MRTADALAGGQGPKIGELVERFELDKAWLVDPVSGREGPGEIVVVDGVLESVNWLEGPEAAGVTDSGVVVAPGFPRHPRPFPRAGL
jgi:adenine deaminase